MRIAAPRKRLRVPWTTDIVSISPISSRRAELAGVGVQVLEVGETGVVAARQELCGDDPLGLGVHHLMQVEEVVVIGSCGRGRASGSL